jgi:hypothetical protein
MLAQREAGAPPPRRVVVEIARATGMVLAEAEAAGRAALTAAYVSGRNRGDETFLRVRLDRLRSAADDVIAAARAGNSAEMRLHLRRFDVLTSAIWAVQDAVYGSCPAPRAIRRPAGTGTLACSVAGAPPFHQVTFASTRCLAVGSRTDCREADRPSPGMTFAYSQGRASLPIGSEGQGPPALRTYLATYLAAGDAENNHLTKRTVEPVPAQADSTPGGTAPGAWRPEGSCYSRATTARVPVRTLAPGIAAVGRYLATPAAHGMDPGSDRIARLVA